jgi:DNA-binding CsgD family transcriptional regulator
MSMATEQKDLAREQKTIRSSPGLTGASRLLEREEHLAALQNLWSDDSSARPAGIVIVGGWGSGKSALLETACARASAAGVRVARARGRNGELRHRFAVAEEAIEALGCQGFNSFDQRCAALRAMRQPETPPCVVELLLDAFINCDQPLLFAVDDADAADAESLTVLNAVVHRLAPGRSHLLVTTNPRPPGRGLRQVDWLAADAGAWLLRIEPLSAEAVDHLTRAFFAEPVHPDFVQEVWEATAGRPLLLVHLLSELDRQHRHPDAAAAPTVLNTPVTEIASDVLMRLPPPPSGARELLQGLAVLGDGADPGVVRSLVGLDALATQQAIDAAMQAEILEPELPLRFTAPIARAAIYHDITPTRRGRLHDGAARLLAAQSYDLHAVCDHLLKTEPSGNPSTAETLERGGRAALAEGQHQRARQCFVRSLAEPPPGERLSDVLLELVSVELELMSPDALGHVVRAARIGTADPNDLAVVATRVLRTVPGPAVPDGDTRAVLIAVRDRLDPAAVRPLLDLSLALCRTGETGSPEELDALARLAERLGPGEPMIAREAMSYVLQQRFKTGACGPYDEIADQLQLRFDPAEMVAGDPFGSEIQLSTAAALLCCGRFDVDDTLRVAAAAAAERSRPDTERDITSLLALSSLWQGGLDRAITISRRAISLGGPVDQWGPRLARACLVASLLEKGALEEAMATDPALLVDDGANDHGNGAALVAAVVELFGRETRGRLWLAAGQAHHALEHFSVTGTRAAELGVENPAVSAWPARVGTAEAAIGCATIARRVVTDHLARARALGVPRTLGSALRTLAGIPGEGAALDLLAEAVQVLDPSPARLEAAKAQLDLGRRLLAVGRETEARSVLRRAAHLASLCGADSLVEKATHELHAAGCRPRRAALTGWAALTPAETRVARLAASGANNAEIARRLYVSEKTVEGHLGRVFRKLGIRSRLKLPAVLAVGTEGLAVGTEGLAVGTEGLAVGTEGLAVGTEGLALGPASDIPNPSMATA